MVHSELDYVWRCEGCDANGVFDPETSDILEPLHHCPLITGPYSMVPTIHITEKEKTDGSTEDNV